MTKNEMEIAKWLGIKMRDGLFFIPVMQGTVNARTEPSVQLILDHNLLHEAWVKFRDLKFDDFQKPVIGYTEHLNRIEYAMLYKSITEAFDELVKGIEWYNSLNR